MGLRRPPFEVILLGQPATGSMRARVLGDIKAVLTSHNVSLIHAAQVAGGKTHLSCDKAQIHLAFAPAPLPVEQFLDAHRPGYPICDTPDVLQRLQDHSARITVLVSESSKPGARGDAALHRRLAWDIADCVNQVAAPDLVYWAERDMLYAAEEFDHACTYDADQGLAFAQTVQMRATLQTAHTMTPAAAPEPVIAEEAVAKPETSKVSRFDGPIHASKNTPRHMVRHAPAPAKSPVLAAASSSTEAAPRAALAETAATAPRAADRFTEDPVLNDSVLAWIEAQVEESREVLSQVVEEPQAQVSEAAADPRSEYAKRFSLDFDDPGDAPSPDAIGSVEFEMLTDLDMLDDPVVTYDAHGPAPLRRRAAQGVVVVLGAVATLGISTLGSLPALFR